MPVKQFLSVPKLVMGYLAPLLMGWQGRSYWCVIPETNTDTRGTVICHLKEAAQEHPILRLLSHPTLGSYLSRSLQQTHNQHCTPTMNALTSRNDVSSLDGPTTMIFKTLSILFSAYCHSSGFDFWLLSSK